jgi:hypothetical protein
MSRSIERNLAWYTERFTLQVLFLFLVGLEIDVAVIKRNAKTSMTISAGGMILPFAIGAGVAVPVYNIFIDPEASSFGHFLRESADQIPLFTSSNNRTPQSLLGLPIPSLPSPCSAVSWWP